MGCVIVILGLIMPRVLMIFVALLTDWFGRAFNGGVLWPILGWIFLPYTTLAYMAAMLRNDHQLTGWWIVLLVLAVLVDIGAIGGSRRK
ncbi:MAG TPA: hypothetical protein VNA25_03905 [Phycisphaerae bacterium]|nr:hypothetical protein [Phycisphaerae bacterium]